MANKWVYMFSEGDMTMRNLLGGKGANLAEMTSIGLPVPQGFTITTEACTQYYEDGRKNKKEKILSLVRHCCCCCNFSLRNNHNRRCNWKYGLVFLYSFQF